MVVKLQVVVPLKLSPSVRAMVAVYVVAGVRPSTWKVKPVTSWTTGSLPSAVMVTVQLSGWGPIPARDRVAETAE